MGHFLPLVQSRHALPGDAPLLAGGPLGFEFLQALDRRSKPERLHWRDLPGDVLEALTRPRPPLLGMALDRPRIMGILNVTPDSFSDGGEYDRPDLAAMRAGDMAARGVDILDIGGESTRPGAAYVPADEEIARTVPVIEAVAHLGLPVSIDTRKTAVAKAALAAGADLVNDVSGLTHDPEMAGLVAKSGVPVCIMHSQGDPKVMQDAPHYDDVLRDVYDWLEAQIAVAETAGIPREKIIVDPGIGFGKTQAHNLALLRGLALFHGLGSPILLGVSRKRFIGVIGNAPEPAHRAPGSLAVGLHGVAQGVQILRVHDTAETHQALALWTALDRGEDA